ncbi:uncharacterized protein [Amphiura filiformis]|uniref:uncharacterized protein n=1 Tax=Amphiura filiformis TaxID=82378 RepID=UPI003B22507F
MEQKTEVSWQPEGRGDNNHAASTGQDSIDGNNVIVTQQHAANVGEQKSVDGDSTCIPVSIHGNNVHDVSVVEQQINVKEQRNVSGDSYQAQSMVFNIDNQRDDKETKHSNLTVQDLVGELKTHYLNKLCKKQLFPWECESYVDLNDIYVQLTVDKVIPKPNKTIKIPLQFYHLIFEHNEEQRRFILEGRPGLGKSTLCSKIAHDWCHRLDDKDRNSPLNHIELLFVLELGKVDYKSNIEEEIVKQLLHASASPFHDLQWLRKTIETCGKSVVIILDALDESDPDLLVLRHEEVGSIVRILTFDELSSCRVLVTSRPWRIKEMMEFKYRRLELQPFNKKKILEYMKQFFAVDDPLSRTLGARLSKMITNNELVVDVSIPMISLLICWYWKVTEGKQEIPKRRSELYDAIISTMYQSCVQKRQNCGLTQNTIVQELGAIAVKGLTPTKTPTLVFNRNEIIKSSSNELANVACAMGVISQKDDHANSLTFFHKSGQEHIAGKYLADNPDELRSYLSAINTVDTAMATGLVLISAAAENTDAAKEVMTSLMKLFDDELDVKETMSLYYNEKLSVDETRRVQQFIELCLECNYEADAKLKFNEMLSRLFKDGQVYCFGVQPYPAVALGYYMEHSDSWIRSFKLQAVAHPHDPQIYYGPGQEINQQIFKGLKIIPDEEVQQMCNEYKKEHREILHKELLELPPAEFVAYIELMQRCEGLPSTSDTNLGPIIKSFKHIKLEKLAIDNFKLGRNLADFVKSVNNGHMISLTEFWAASVTSTGEQTTRLVSVVDKMPALKTLGIHRNDIEHGETLPTLAQKLVRCTSLQKLHISDYNAPAEDMIAVFKELPRLSTQLQALITVNNHMNDDAATILSKTLPETITNLGISVCDISRQKHKELLTGLHRLVLLEKLRLKDSPYPDDMVECVGTGLTSWSQMQEFTLICRPKDDRDDETMQQKVPQISAGAWEKMKKSLKSARHITGIRFSKICLANRSFTELLEICQEKENFKYLRYTRACLSEENVELCNDNEYEFVTLD